MHYKITHLTSAHPRYDTRIFVKECSSLAKKYQVNLVVADGLGDEEKNGVTIYDMGKVSGRVNRIFSTTKRVLQKAIELDSDVYHMHDSELIPVGLKLKKLGKKVIFDSHEDVPKELLGKPYLNPLMLKIISKFFAFYEKINLKKFDYIVTATPTLQEKFLKINPNVVAINNFPIIEELQSRLPWEERENSVCYVGAISISRGVRESVQALKYYPKVKLNLGGKFPQPSLQEEVMAYESWKNVNFLGYLNRNEVASVLSRSKAGLVTLHNMPNYKDALPVKMFEYMAAALPVISSNNKLWKSIIDKHHCGICVDPMNPKEIAGAIQYIIENPKEAQKMGENGKKAVSETYNWGREEEKLFVLYQGMVNEI
jgi:glycosyltransferase involved in cell wall biosynthesis